MGIFNALKSNKATAMPLDIAAAKLIHFQYSGFRNTNAYPNACRLFLYCNGYESGIEGLVTDANAAGLFSNDWCTALAHFEVSKKGIIVSGSVDAKRWFTVGEVAHDDIEDVKKALANGLPLLSLKASPGGAYNASGYNIYYSIWPVYK